MADVDVHVDHRLGLTELEPIYHENYDSNSLDDLNLDYPTIHDLPPELILDIFHYGASYPPYPSGFKSVSMTEYGMHPFATTVSVVCSRWRNIVMENLEEFLFIQASLYIPPKLDSDGATGNSFEQMMSDYKRAFVMATKHPRVRLDVHWSLFRRIKLEGANTRREEKVELSLFMHGMNMLKDMVLMGNKRKISFLTAWLTQPQAAMHALKVLAELSGRGITVEEVVLQQFDLGGDVVPVRHLDMTLRMFGGNGNGSRRGMKLAHAFQRTSSLNLFPGFTESNEMTGGGTNNISNVTSLSLTRLLLSMHTTTSSKIDSMASLKNILDAMPNLEYLELGFPGDFHTSLASGTTGGPSFTTLERLHYLEISIFGPIYSPGASVRFLRTLFDLLRMPKLETLALQLEEGDPTPETEIDAAHPTLRLPNCDTFDVRFYRLHSLQLFRAISSPLKSVVLRPIGFRDAFELESGDRDPDMWMLNADRLELCGFPLEEACFLLSCPGVKCQEVTVVMAAAAGSDKGLSTWNGLGRKGMLPPKVTLKGFDGVQMEMFFERFESDVEEVSMMDGGEEAIEVLGRLKGLKKAKIPLPTFRISLPSSLTTASNDFRRLADDSLMVNPLWNLKTVRDLTIFSENGDVMADEECSPLLWFLDADADERMWQNLRSLSVQVPMQAMSASGLKGVVRLMKRIVDRHLLALEGLLVVNENGRCLVDLSAMCVRKPVY